MTMFNGKSIQKAHSRVKVRVVIELGVFEANVLNEIFPNCVVRNHSCFT